MDAIIKVRDKTLKMLAHRLEGFYLAGGTALSLFYFQHRESFDLDFFTKDFSRIRIEEIMSELSKQMGLSKELSGEHNRKGYARMMVYALKIDENSSLKIDFVEDVYTLLKPCKEIDGISILSIEDIYVRKIFTACGSIATVDSVGRPSFIGGRQEAKDFFDLYFLSKTFMPLSKFVNEYCQQPQKESIIIWYRTFDRLQMKTGLMDIMTNKNVSFPDMDIHFRDEVRRITAAEL